MADKLEIEEQLFRKAAGKTGDVRDKVNGILDDLAGSLKGRGKPWGTDKLGKQFYEGEGGKGGYKDSHKNMVEGAHNVSATMDNFHQAQVKSADLLDRMDHGNSDGYK